MTTEADAQRAVTVYAETHAAVVAEPVGSLARRLHSALGDLAHAVLATPAPAPEPTAWLAYIDFGPHDGGKRPLGVADTIDGARMIAEGHMDAYEIRHAEEWSDPDADDGESWVDTGDRGECYCVAPLPSVTSR